MTFNLGTVKLEDIADVKSGKRLPKGHQLSEEATPYPYIRLVDISDGRIQTDDLKFLEEKTRDSIKRYIVNTNDVCLAIVGHSIGMVFYVEEAWDNVNLTENAARITNVSKSFNPRFIYYYLTSDKGQNEIISRKVGSAQGKLPLYNIKSLELPNLPRKIQDSIVTTLDCLSFKVETNRQINQTLEQIAQAIFKSWFVDFEPVKAKIAARVNLLKDTPAANDAQISEAEQQAAINAISGDVNGFTSVVGDRMSETTSGAVIPTEQLQILADQFPNQLVESELGEIPEGWGLKAVGDFCNTFDYVANGSFKALKENVTLYDDPNEVLYVRTTDYNKSFNGALKYTDQNSYEFLKKSKLFGKEVIISNVGDVGTVFRAPVWLDMPMTLGSNAVALDSEEHNSYIFWLFRSDYGQHLIQSIVTGSAQLKFNKTNLRSLELLWPSEKLLKHFEIIESSICELYNSNSKQQKQLEELRDTLLPKLLSGEIDLTSAEKDSVNA